MIFLSLSLRQIENGPFRAALDPRLDAGFGELALDLVGDAGDALRGLRVELLQPLHDRLARLRVQLGEREIFELLAHVLHADAPGERRVDLDVSWAMRRRVSAFLM